MTDIWLQPSTSGPDRGAPSSPATPINPFATPRKSSHPPAILSSPLYPSSVARSLSFGGSLLSSPASAPQPSSSATSIPAIVLRSTSSADIERDKLPPSTAAVVPSLVAASSTRQSRRGRPRAAQLPSTPSTAPSRLQQLRRRSTSRSSSRLSSPSSASSSTRPSAPPAPPPRSSPSRHKLEWWPAPRHRSPAAVRQAKQYSGLHHSTGIGSSAADEMKGEARQKVRRDMQAWQQRVDAIHHRQRQQGQGGSVLLDSPANKRHGEESSNPAAKRALFAATALKERDRASDKKVRATADNSGEDEAAEDDVSGVELLKDDETERGIEESAEGEQESVDQRENETVVRHRTRR